MVESGELVRKKHFVNPRARQVAGLSLLVAWPMHVLYLKAVWFVEPFVTGFLTSLLIFSDYTRRPHTFDSKQRALF